MGKITVSDSGFEVLRRAAQDSEDGSKYDMRTFLANSELVSGIDYDEIAITYPTDTTEIYTYKLSAVSIRTVTLTYLASDKSQLSSAVIA